MSLVEKNVSRAPLLPLENKLEAIEGELFIEETDAHIKLCFKKKNGYVIDLLSNLIDVAVDELIAMKPQKFSDTPPENSYETLWLKTITVEEDQL